MVAEPWMMNPSGSVGADSTQRRLVWAACTATTSTSPTCSTVSRRVSITVLKPTRWIVRPTSGGPITTADLDTMRSDEGSRWSRCRWEMSTASM